MFEDDYLIRFLIARKYDLDKTILMYNNFLEFRKKYDIENFIRNFSNDKFDEL